MIQLTTERLCLRNFKTKDAHIMHDYRNNELCSRYQQGQTKDYAGIVQLVEAHKTFPDDFLQEQGNLLLLPGKSR